MYSDNKPEHAAAIDNTGQEPRVLASGKNLVAEEIIEIAKKNNIPIISDPALLESLAKLDINSFLPDNIYPAVSEIVAFLYDLESKTGGNEDRVE